MNIETIKAKISLLENYDLSKSNTNDSISEFRIVFFKLLNLFRKFPSVNFRTESQEFVRCRKNSTKTTELTFDKLWYPKNAQDPYFNRLSHLGNPVLYSSDNARTAIYEIQPDVGDWITILYFNTKSPVVIMDYFIEDDNATQYFNDHVGGDYFYKYLIKEFRRIVPKGKEYLYLPTMLLSKFLKNDCFIYSSVATKFAGLNFAFKPSFIDNNCTFTRARIIEILAVNLINEDYLIRCLFESTENDDGKIKFYKSDTCEGHWISKNITH